MAAKDEAARQARDQVLQETIETPARKTRPRTPLQFINEQMRALDKPKPAKKKRPAGAQPGK